jgi:hypothetical protein
MLFRSIYTAVAGGDQGDGLYATAWDGHLEVAVCEAIEKSHRQRAWVDV